MSSRPASVVVRSIALPAVLAVALAGCRDDAPKPVSALSPPSTAAARPTPAGPVTVRDVDPSAPQISDLARVSRFVFREMLLRQAECSTDGLPAGVYSYTLEVAVAAGRIAKVALVDVAFVVNDVPQAMSREMWPPTLTAYVSCLEPHLGNVVLEPAPAPGNYPTQFAAQGAVPGRSAR